MIEYLKKVLLYLKQELPYPYNLNLTVDISGDKFLITLPNDVGFAGAYDELFKLINIKIHKVKARKCDLHFNIKSKYQERNFKILR